MLHLRIIAVLGLLGCGTSSGGAAGGSACEGLARDVERRLAQGDVAGARSRLDEVRSRCDDASVVRAEAAYDRAAQSDCGAAVKAVDAALARRDVGEAVRHQASVRQACPGTTARQVDRDVEDAVRAGRSP